MNYRDDTTSGKRIRNRRIVSDKAIEVLVYDVIREAMKDRPDISTKDAAVGLLNAAIFVASRLPGVEWADISHFMKTMTDVIDASTEAEMEASYRSSQALH